MGPRLRGLGKLGSGRRAGQEGGSDRFTHRFKNLISRLVEFSLPLQLSASREGMPGPHSQGLPAFTEGLPHNLQCVTPHLQTRGVWDDIAHVQAPVSSWLRIPVPAVVTLPSGI
jgi:hypothetical protein